MNTPGNGHDSRYPIGVVTRRTGLSPDVLRVWERRYSVVTPVRSAGGQRLYSVGDIEKLRLLRRLVEGGHRIASVASLDVERLSALAREAGDAPNGTSVDSYASEELLADLLAAVDHLDDVRLAALLRRSAMTLGTEAWIEGAVGPLLEAVGDRWHAGAISPAHEHLATATARDALGWVMRSYTPPIDAPKILVATPAGELHELGAMMAAVTAAEAGWHVQYLGPNIPAVDLAKAAMKIGSDAVALSLVHPDHAERTVNEIRELRRALPPSVAVIVGGATAIVSADQLAAAGATVAPDARAFRAELESIRPAS